MTFGGKFLAGKEGGRAGAYACLFGVGLVVSVIFSDKKQEVV